MTSALRKCAHETEIVAENQETLTPTLVITNPPPHHRHETTHLFHVYALCPRHGREVLVVPLAGANKVGVDLGEIRIVQEMFGKGFIMTLQHEGEGSLARCGMFHAHAIIFIPPPF